MQTVNIDILFFKVFRDVYLESLIKNQLYGVKCNKKIHVKSIKDAEANYQYLLKVPSFIQIVLEIDNSGDESDRYETFLKSKQRHVVNYLVLHYKITNKHNASLLDYENDNHMLLNEINCLKVSSAIYCINYLPRYTNISKLVLDIIDLPLEAGTIPNTVTDLTINSDYSYPLHIGVIPSSVINLSLRLFNQPLLPGQIPFGVESLRFLEFNEPIKQGDLPESLTHLDLGYCFNRNITPNSLPSSLTHLEFKYTFNQPLAPHSLPPNLKILNLGSSFEQKINTHSIPKHVVKVVFGSFDQEILTPGIIPDSVEEVIFSSFNRVIVPGTIPKSTRVLKFGNYFSRPLEVDCLPPNIKLLEFGEGFNEPLKPNILPRYLRTLIFESCLTHDLMPNVLPLFLKTLSIGLAGDIAINVLPPTLTTLILKTFKGMIHPFSLPDSLETLKFSSSNCNFKSLENQNVINSGLKHLSLPKSILSLNICICIPPSGKTKVFYK
ncbi:hypothetical protein CYY_005037 [Polysphondylium violaceum]|uniref:FNIP repeat-containing protein n=1 Tax=Polysphondylium violaceum TaxID=133409 RepID=A0A8J4V4L1_9MYCE|nr:hypothetical protein CYY_005037 [Polysphondylium violaceum]